MIPLKSQKKCFGVVLNVHRLAEKQIVTLGIALGLLVCTVLASYLRLR